MKLNDILREYLGDTYPRSLSIALQEWKQDKSDDIHIKKNIKASKYERLKRLEKNISRDLEIDITDRSREHQYILGRHIFIGIAWQSIVPNDRVIANTLNRTGQGVILHYNKTREAFFMAYPQHKPLYNKYAVKYGIPLL